MKAAQLRYFGLDPGKLFVVCPSLPRAAVLSQQSHQSSAGCRTFCCGRNPSLGRLHSASKAQDHAFAHLSLGMLSGISTHPLRQWSVFGT